MYRGRLLGLGLSALLLWGCDEGSTAHLPDAVAPVADADVASDSGNVSDVQADGTLVDAGPDGSQADVSRGTVEPLTVVSWNIEQFPKNSFTITKVATIILERGFDVIAVQEVAEPAEFYTLLDALPGYDGVLNDDPGNFIRVGIIYRTAAVTLDWSVTEFGDDGWAFPRPPLVAKLTAPRSDGSVAFDFVMVVLHLKAQLDAQSESRRREACVKLDQWLSQQMAFGEEKDYVLLGDWNDKLDDPPQWNVFGPLLDKTDDYVFLTQPAVRANDISFLAFPGLIDHTLITRDALHELNGGITFIPRLDQEDSFYQFDVSDHLPVVTTFELR